MRIILYLLSFLFTLPLFGQTWNQISTQGNIPARANASMIYHPDDHAIYVFGGQTSGGKQNDFWKLDLETYIWSEISASGTPPSDRHTHNAVLDEQQNQMIIFSGQGAGLFNDVWSFDFDTQQWAQRSANGNTSGKPNQRYGTATVYDPIGFRLVTFGGFGNNGRQDDTWSFDLLGEQWGEANTPVSPIKRCLHNGTYVPGRHLMVIYGGQSSGNQDDIWTFDLSVDSWTNRTPSIKPPGRHFCSITAIGEDHLYLFGGNGANQNVFAGARNDLWRFSFFDDSWSEITPTNSPPAVRVGHCAVFIPSTSQLLIFGGNTSSGGYLNDVWVLDDFISSTKPAATIHNDVRFKINSANPVQSEIQYQLQLKQSKRIKVSIMDASGKVIQQLFDRYVNEGEHIFSTDVSTLPQGWYFLMLESDGTSQVIWKFVKS